MSTHDDIANALSLALETGELEPLLGLLAPGSTVWHNHDRARVDAKLNMEGAAQLRLMVDDVKIDVVSRVDTATGFVQQFVLRGSLKSSGAALELHNCIVAEVDGGKLVRLDEYVDPAMLSAFA